MPAFDPVRDAVLNSPITQSKALPFQQTRLDISSNANINSPLPSPSLGRRATDLSVLLNSEPSPPIRSSNRNQIFHSPSEDKLNSVQPLKAVQQPQKSSSAIAGPSIPRDSSSRPSSSSSAAPMHRKSTIPYNPLKRITPPDSVLRPMSPEEMKMFQTYTGVATSRLSKRKRTRSTEPEAKYQPPLKKVSGDVGVVVDHYNSRPDVGVVQRLESPIIGLKNFNNWVKSVLITRFAHPVLAASPGPKLGSRGKGRGKVLDMGCGKGGDLMKWGKAGVRELIGVDIADKSVEQARDRWQSMKGRRFDATFATVDCYLSSLNSKLAPAKLADPFDVVSMQFCMHYAFENVAKARCMLENVSRWLRPGGIFIGTIPNAEQLLENLDALPPDAEELSFGNAVYKIRFEDRKTRPVFGHKYWFFLQDAVEDVPEYVVHWDNFVQMAAEYKLYPKYKKEFHEVYQEHEADKEFGALLVRMKVRDADENSSMTEEQWEAANIYIAFALEKRT